MEALGAALSKAWFDDTVTYGQSYKNILHESDDACITSESNKVVNTFCRALCGGSDNPQKRIIELAMEQQILLAPLQAL